MKFSRNKTVVILISTLLLLSMVTSIILPLITNAQVYPPPGTHVPSYAQLNVAPNPAGIGQSVTLNMYLAVPLETSGNNVATDRATGFMLEIKDPAGKTTTLGPFTADATGGTYTIFTPDQLGNYSIQFKYPGQLLTGNNATSNPRGWGGLITDPSNSPVVTLVAQEEMVTQSSYPVVPLPTSWWETPATAENIQEWYKICGPWLGLSANSFAATGSYNSSTYCNPYTASVRSGHVLWTKPWGPGGVAGGEFGGTESSNYWTTRQYSPNWAPVIMNGIMYSTQYTLGTSTGFNNGIVAVNLFTGETQFIINTTNALRCGSMFSYKNPNQYGVVGPYIWTTGTLPAADTGGIYLGNPSYMNTTGTQWNMYDGYTGRYVLSIVNGSGLTLSTDDQGGLVGYFINNTLGAELVHPNNAPDKIVNNTVPHLDCFNFTRALTTGTGLNFQPNRNAIIDFRSGIQFAEPIPNNISGLAINPVLAINTVTENYVCLTGGFIHGQGVGGEQAGWLVISSMDGITGATNFVRNVTETDSAVMEPYTRLTYTWGQGDLFVFDGFNWKGASFDMKTGTKNWEMQLTAPEGYKINDYDVFNFKAQYANNVVVVQGFGGDLFGVDATTGKQLWSTNTNKMLGDPGQETPYGTWPLWVFSCQAQSADIEYCAIGHEYNPPLFHGAQLLALNLTSGDLTWKELGFYTRAMAIAYGVLLSNNAYDNQIYAFGKGPSKITVTAPNIGVATSTPITITGTVTDISPGTEQDAISRNYPNGIPAVSEESQSAFMETVYQQQPMQSNVTGVPITISVFDSNHNYRPIGTTTSDALGTFGFTWTPDIAGDYTVFASFAGSESYYPSSASTHLYASETPTTAPTTAPPSNLVTTADLLTYLVGGVIAIIIAIAVVGILLLRKHP